VTDIVGNAVTAIGLANAVGAASYVADTTAPQVTAFQLDMDGAGSITLTFSESVDPSSIRFDHFQIQRGGADTSASLYLSAAAVVASSTVLDTIVSAQLTLSDSNELKRLATLATSRANTYLSVQAGGIVDWAGNQLATIASSSAMQATSFTADATRPALSSFSLDMNSAIITLSFTETVDVSTFSATALTLQDAATASVWFTLTTGSILGSNSDTVQVQMSVADHRNLEKLIPLAGDVNHAYIRMQASAIKDMAGLSVVAISDGSAVQAISYVSDTTAPTLQQFTLNLNTGVMTFTFSKTVNGASFDPTQVTLQSSSSSAGLSASAHMYTLTGGSASQARDTVVTLTLSTADLNAVKLRPAVAIVGNTVYAALTATTVVDMFSNQLTPVLGTAAHAAASFTADGTAPQLVSFDIDMNVGTLLLSFSEPVDASMFVSSALTVQSLQNVNGNAALAVTLTAASTTSSANGLALLVNIGNSDLNAMKRIRSLAHAASSSFLVLTSAAVKDMSGNAVVAITDGSAVAATAYTSDSTSPQLGHFNLDMNTGLLALYFDEVMNIDTLHRSYFKLQSSQTSDGVHERLLNP